VVEQHRARDGVSRKPVSPVAHFLGSWLIAAVATNNPRDRMLVTLAGVLPDADGLGIVVDLASSVIAGKEPTFQYYQQYHHYLLHGWPGAIAVAALLSCFTRQHWRVAWLCLITFHLHLLCDFIGSRGPTPEDLWPIAYSEPLFHHPIFFWKNQWRLDGWQNRIICVTLVLTELCLAARRGYSCVEIFNRKFDATFVAVLRKWRAALPGGSASG
jgi:inner membrane protein